MITEIDEIIWGAIEASIKEKRTIVLNSDEIGLPYDALCDSAYSWSDNRLKHQGYSEYWGEVDTVGNGKANFRLIIE